MILDVFSYLFASLATLRVSNTSLLDLPYSIANSISSRDIFRFNKSVTNFSRFFFCLKSLSAVDLSPGASLNLGGTQTLPSIGVYTHGVVQMNNTFTT